MMPPKQYYPGLSGLRAIAALLVLFTHVQETLRPAGGFPDPGFNAFLGGIAVTFFFVLSGVLITGLLLNEKKYQGIIRLKRFFINRALRIWPLYYLVLIAGYALSIFVIRDTSADPIANGFVLNAALLPNIAFASALLPKILVQLWSIGPEEQFYFSWPFLVSRLREKQLAYVFSGIVLFWAIATAMLRLFFRPDTWLHILLFRTRIDCMAIGGLAALWLFMRPPLSMNHLLHRRATGLAATALFLLLLWMSYRYRVSLYQPYAALFAVLILRVMTRPAGWLDAAPLRYLGKISYGIYLLHPFAIYVIFHALRAPDFLLLPASALLTIGLAAFSYHFFESRFLRKKP